MVSALLDTSIVIDLVREYALAEQWLVEMQELGVSGAVWLEVLDGVTNRDGQRRAIRMLHRFEKIALISADIDWATDQAILYRLSHSVGSMDCLIASASHRLQLPLYTTNLKHFKPLLEELAQKPY